MRRSHAAHVGDDEGGIEADLLGKRGEILNFLCSDSSI